MWHHGAQFEGRDLLYVDMLIAAAVALLVGFFMLMLQILKLLGYFFFPLWKCKGLSGQVVGFGERIVQDSDLLLKCILSQGSPWTWEHGASSSASVTHWWGLCGG